MARSSPAFTIFLLPLKPTKLDFYAVHHAFVFAGLCSKLFSQTNFDKEVAATIKSLEQDLIRWRRHLHANPELSNREFNTMQYIFDVRATATDHWKGHGQNRVIAV